MCTGLEPLLLGASLAAGAGGTALQVAGQGQQAAAQAGQANYLSQVARNNQIAAERNAARALQQGEADTQRSQLRTAALAGSQRAALASQGGDVDSGSPLDIQADTARAGATDAATIRSNAALKAYNYRLQADDAAARANDDLFQGANAMAGLPYAQGSSLLGGASSLFGGGAALGQAIPGEGQLMTVSSTSSRVVLPGNGTTVAWPFAFNIQQPADLVVVYTDATGSDVTLSAGQYDATGFGQDMGGTVTYPKSGSGTPAIAAGTTLTIWRKVAATQPTSISNQGAMWPQVIEAALDRLTMIVQGFIDRTSRALSISATDGTVLNPLPAATGRANSVLGFNAGGQPYAATLVASMAGVASWLFANFLQQATSAANACAAIGAASLTAANQAFTGTVTFVTQAPGDTGTSAATTAYADRAAALRSVGATGVSFNAANSDNAVAIRLPTGFTRYRVERVVISNASHTLATATCGLFTAAAAGGVAVVAGASAITVSATADATANNMQSLALASGTTSFMAATLYFRVQTAEGAAATGDVTIFYQPLP